MSNAPYGYRQCGGRGGRHYHVTSGGSDLIGGYCRTEEEAREKADLLNGGAGTDEVLGRLEDHLFPTTKDPDV